MNLGIRLFLIVYFLFSVECAWPDSKESHLPTVMITNFVPFQGKKQNGSQIVIDKLVANHNLKNEPYNIYVCTLPVQYQKAADVAKECFLKMKSKPDMIVSTGEAYCDTLLETRYQNLDNYSKLPDNSGKILINQRIDNKGKNEIPSTLPLATMYCAGNGAKLSINPTNYVCNDTAYRLSEYFGQLHIPYGFIHVPQASCGPAALANSTQLIAKMLSAGVEKIKSEEPDPGSCCDHKAKPTLLADLSHVLKTFTGSLNKSCENKYDRDLKQILATPQH